MLRNTKELYGNHLAATDGDIGQVKDFYFDDKAWVIRYLVVNTGSWLTGRHVLISPHAFAKWDHSENTLHLKLHKKQIEDSPSLESHKPVSRQYEIEYHRYYGWRGYWNLHPMSGLNTYPEDEPTAKDAADNPHRHQRDDKHLRSAHAVTGYHIQASDGAIGHVSGLLVDDRSWAIRELVVETGHWYSGKKVLISPGKIERISYEDSKVFVNLTKADIQRTAENTLAAAGAGHHRMSDSTE
jgi:uncharacterized protein YrrD